MLCPSRLDLTHVLGVTALHAHNTLHTRGVCLTPGSLRITTGIVPRVRFGFIFLSSLLFPLPVTPKRQDPGLKLVVQLRPFPVRLLLTECYHSLLF